MASPAACSNAEERAAEIYATAQFEEEQFNPEHASEIYQEILQRHPETSFAEKASKRLEALEHQKPHD